MLRGVGRYSRGGSWNRNGRVGPFATVAETEWRVHFPAGLADGFTEVFHLFVNGEKEPGGRRLWLALAYPCWGLALLGLVVPLLPATPFALLALYAGARGSSRMHARILAHPLLGPAVRDWQAHRVVGRRPKQVATGTMAVSALIVFATAPSRWMAVAATAFMACVALWLWLRPEAPPLPAAGAAAEEAAPRR